MSATLIVHDDVLDHWRREKRTTTNARIRHLLLCESCKQPFPSFDTEEARCAKSRLVRCALCVRRGYQPVGVRKCP